MRMLEIGASYHPSIMSNDPSIEYVGVDPNYREEVCQNRQLFRSRIEELDSEVLGQFDYVYAANVLSNTVDDSVRFRIIQRAASLLLDAGQLVFLETYAPAQANLRKCAPLINGVVIYDRSPLFSDIWRCHRPEPAKEVVTARVAMAKPPMQMLVKQV